MIGVWSASEYAFDDAIEADVRVESAGVGSDSDAKDTLCRNDDQKEIFSPKKMTLTD